MFGKLSSLLWARTHALWLYERWFRRNLRVLDLHNKRMAYPAAEHVPQKKWDKFLKILDDIFSAERREERILRRILRMEHTHRNKRRQRLLRLLPVKACAVKSAPHLRRRKRFLPDEGHHPSEE